MKYYRYTEFTAQSKLVSALMGMYALLEKTPKDTKIEITPFVVFMAFSVEAYLNSIGFRVVDYWDNIERNNWKDKIEILHSIAKKEASWGTEPLQFINDLFKIRDRLAHGKPEKIMSKAYQTRSKVEDVDPTHQEQPDWYKKLDREWALSAKEKFRITMQYLSSLHNLHESDYLHLATGGIAVDDEKA